MERRDLFRSVAGLGAGLVTASATGAANPASSAANAPASTGDIKLGVAVYSYSGIRDICFTFEDCFRDMYDMGCTTFELFTSDIENYPNPSTKWIDTFFGFCEKYQMQPSELANNVDEHVTRGPKMSDDEIVRYQSRDIKLAGLLGFNCIRARMTDAHGIGGGPAPGWERYFEKMLPVLEKNDVMFQPEIKPKIKEKYVDDYIAFIEKHQTKHIGLNVDFSTFRQGGLGGKPIKPLSTGLNRRQEPPGGMPGGPGGPGGGISAAMMEEVTKSSPIEDIIPILKYSRCFHAKFFDINENFEEAYIDYPKLMKIFQDHGWKGALVSEFEGNMADRDNVQEQLRRHHILMRKCLGYTFTKGGNGNA
ncbi:MAG: TIM barrel protein [Bryobacterales bacterium]|nr:TIM barrel protein [Bryobacterales bacterium]